MPANLYEGQQCRCKVFTSQQYGGSSFLYGFCPLYNDRKLLVSRIQVRPSLLIIPRGCLKGAALVRKVRGTCPCHNIATTFEPPWLVQPHLNQLYRAPRSSGRPSKVVRSWPVPTAGAAGQVAAIRAYGGTVEFCLPGLAQREQRCAALAAQHGATVIPPYNHPDVMSGQGTIGLEVLQQSGDVDAVIVPVSGGGLISGVAMALKSQRPGIKVLAAEPCGANNVADVAISKQKGQLVECEQTATIAEGLRGQPRELTWPIVRDFVDDVIQVTEAEILAAMKVCFSTLHTVVEASGAVGAAALLSPAFRTLVDKHRLQHAVVILSGGNLDLQALGLWDAVQREMDAVARSTPS